MKIVFFLMLLVLMGCEPGLKTDWELINDMEKISLSDSIQVDTIFLGFRFGMTQIEFQKHYKYLYKSGKLSKEDNVLKYKFEFAKYPKEAISVFEPKYYNDSLYELGISVFPIVINTVDNSTLDLVKYQLYEQYKRKYSKRILIVESLISGNSDDFILFHGNLKIKILTGISDVRIYYTEINTENEINRIDIDNLNNSDI